MRESLSVSAKGIRKRFGRAIALDGLDLEVREGEVHGFLGPNGAGKSTTIRGLLGQLRFDGGEVSVFGSDPRADASTVHDRLAYVPGDVSLWPGLSGGECIDVLGGLQGHLDPRRRDELIELFELDPTKKARTYSKGNRQKVALVAALSCDVDLYILDEPTSGLDPLMEARFQQTVRRRHEEGRTVLLSSHILDEVDALCDRVTIVRAGATVSTGTLGELRAGTRTTIEAVSAAPPPGLADLPGVADLTSTVTAAGVRTTLTSSHAALAKTVATVAAAEPTELSVHPPSLEQLFLAHYGEQDGEADR